MITEFGKELRKLRIDRGEILKDMADKMEKTSAYISAIECNKREIPDWFIPKLTELYNLTESQVKTFERAKDLSIKSFVINFNGARNDQRDVALKFARTFKNMNSGEVEELQKFFAKFSSQ